MKSILFLLCILLISATYAKTARVAVSFNAPVWCGKDPYSPPPTCILRIESAEDVFSYSGSEKLANTIFRKMEVGQIAALSIWGYSSCDQSIGLLARLNLGKVFAYPEKMEARTWTSFNHLQIGSLDRVAIYPYAEARTRHRHACFHAGLPFHSHERKLIDCHIFDGDVLRDLCISNVLVHGFEAVSAGSGYFFPELDCFVMCSSDNGKRMLAACHFIGGNLFPFEGCGRGLPSAMRGIVQANFARVEHEVLLQREFGPGFVGVSGDELMFKIMNSSQKERALELIHTDIAENEFGRWNLIGSTLGILASDTDLQGRECVLDIFASPDHKFIVVANEKRALCVWMIF